MCGIVGVISAFTNGLSSVEADLFSNMLFLDTLRGADSTGVISVNNLRNVTVHKEASMAPNFMVTKNFREFKQDAISNGVFVFGHNRAATRGDVKDENAHPFVVEDKVILMQNGTYKGSHKHLKDTEVDSHAIAHVLYDEPDIEKALQQVNAAYALVWYDVRTSTLNIIRNDERPLFTAQTKADTILFASEPEFILFAASRCNVALKSKPYSIKEHSLIQYVLDENGTYEMTEKEVDVKYRSRFHSANEFISDDEEYWSHFMNRGQSYRSLPNPHNNSTPFLTGMSDVSRTFPSYVHHGEWAKDYSLSEREMEWTKETVMSLQGKEHVVELFDYKPCNLHNDCRKWFLVGNMITTDNITFLTYFMFDGTEDEAVNYVTKEGFVRGTLGSPIVNRVGDVFVIYTMLFNVQKLPVLTHIVDSNQDASERLN